MAKTYLSARKVKFNEKDISHDHKALAWVSRTVGQLATPVIDIGGEVILGFNKHHIDLALRRKNLIR